MTVWCWLCKETRRPLPGFQCFSFFGMFQGGEGGVSPSKWQCAGEVESTAEHSDCTQSRLEKITSGDVARRKGNVAPVRWNGRWIKLVPEREWIPVSLSLAFEHWRRGSEERCRSWPALWWTGTCKTSAISSLACKLSPSPLNTCNKFKLLCNVR